MGSTPTIHVAIPALNEADHLPHTIESLGRQSWKKTQVWVCVNQPDHWWSDPKKQEQCINNLQTLEYLRGLPFPGLHILDHSSPGKGWQGKHLGVGQARKMLMDSINAVAAADDIIVSMDSDTSMNPAYLESIAVLFQEHRGAVGLSNPYYHRLSGQESLDRAMLRYEIYMRHYAINMWRIGSPYSFTALGSAIALPVSSYRKIGGMTPKKSGEDFYLLQKLRKTGWLLNYNQEWVYPGTRYSDRVFFGTGPALIKGSQGNWSSYPVYDHRLFDQVKETYDLLPGLFLETIPTPMSNFLREQFRCEDVFDALRRNFKTPEQFIKACHHKIDGLRILQFLKSSQEAAPYSNEKNMSGFLRYFIETERDALVKCLDSLPEGFRLLPPTEDQSLSVVWLRDLLIRKDARETLLQQIDCVDFEKSPIDELNFIRNLQCSIERTSQFKDLTDDRTT
jgi:hypothetical protein